MLNSTWHPSRAEQNGRIARPFSFHGEGEGQGANSFRAPMYSNGRTEKAAEKAIAAIIRACSSIHYGEQLARQPVSGRRCEGVVVRREGRGMGAMNFIMQEPSQWETLSRWRRAPAYAPPTKVEILSTTTDCDEC